MADLDLTVGVDTAAAEEGLRRLNGQFDRTIRGIDRKRATAKLDADGTNLDRKIAKAKQKLLDLEKQKANPEVDLNTKEFNAEVLAVKARLKELGMKKTHLRVETKQLRDANQLALISSQRQEEMAKQTEKLDRTKEKMARTTRRETDNFLKQRLEVEKLRERYAKLAGEEMRLRDKTGRPGGIFRTPAENRALERTRRELDLVRSRIIGLNGSILDIDPDLDRHDNKLAQWARSLSKIRLHLGFFSGSIKQVGIGLAFLSPQLTGLLGAATSLVGVLGTGLAGALTSVTAGLAGFITSAIGVGLIIKPIIGDLEAATKASEAYHEAVLKYGKGSDQANTAQEKLQQTLKGISPQAREAIKSWGTVKDTWNELTETAREPVFEAAGESIKTVQALLPTFARESTRTTEVLASGWERWMGLLRSQGARAGLQEIMANFRRGLPPLLDGFESLGTIIARIAVSASQFLPGLNRGFAVWADNLERSVGRGQALDEKIGRLIKHMREFGHFAQAAGRLTVTLFSTSADSGAGLLRTLTDLFNGWSDWMQTIEGRRSLRQFFAEAAEESKALFALLGRLLGLIFQLGRATAPISDAFVSLLRTVGAIVDAATDIGVLNTTLRTTAKILVGIWAVNKARAFAAAVAGAARSLGLLAAAQAGAAGTGAVAGGAAAGAGGAAAGAAAGRSAAGGLAGGLLGALKRLKWGRIGTIGLGIALADQVIKEFGHAAAERSDELAERINAMAERSLGERFAVNIWEPQNFFGESKESKAAKNIKAQLEQIAEKRTMISARTERQLRLQTRELDLTKEQRREINEVFKLTRLGRKAGIRVTGGMDPQQIGKLLSGFRTLRSGALASLGDIGKVTRDVSRSISVLLPRGSDEMRAKLAENFRAAAGSIKKAMEDETINVKQGTARMKQLLRNARLLEGRDPLGLARGFAASWEKASGISRRESDRIITDLQKMPPRARREAFRMMMLYGRGLVNGKKIPEEDLRQFRSAAITELQGIGGGFGNLSGTVYEALTNIGKNLQAALKDLGIGKPPQFNLQKLVQQLPKLRPIGRQQGGFTVPGYGSGDSVRAPLPLNSFVMNREATSHFGLRRGGSVLTELEPKERVFMPDEVKRFGAGRLEAMNAAVPRQKGGPVGIGPEPQIAGPPGAVRDTGQGAIRRAYSAAKRKYDKAAATAPLGGVLGSAPGALGAVERLAASMGLSMTSGHRPWDTGSYHAINRARDFADGPVAMKQFALAVAKRWGSRLLELIYSPLGWSIDNGRRTPPFAIPEHYDHVHVAMQMGGLIQKLRGGGSVGEWDRLTGSHWDNDELATLAHLANMQNPGFMAQKAQGESTGNRKAVGRDPGGTEGLGLWQITTKHNDDKIAKYGGRDSMFHPYYNAQAAKEVQDEGGAFYAPPIGPRGSVVTSLADRMRAIVGGGAVGSSSEEKVPKSVKATYNTYGVRGSTLIGRQHKDAPVAVELPEFGPIPKGEENIRRELSQVERILLPKYRAAYRQTKGSKTKAKLKQALGKIEQRIRLLRDALRKERLQKARRKTKRKHQRQLGSITGRESLIEIARREYEKRNQDAEQIVALEPEQPGEITHDWITKTLEPYIRGREEPAYGAVLESENRWRNTILGAQGHAEAMSKWWEIQIGYPQKGRKPWLENPDLHWPPRNKNVPTGLADWIYKTHDQIQRIRNFAKSKSPKWWRNHPNARRQRDQELSEIPMFEGQMNQAKFSRGSLTDVLGQGRESFTWFNGTGSFEDALTEVQGIHWPDQHTKLPGLPPHPVAGMFGGAIWETQEAIRGLGLKIKQAQESIGGDTTQTDRENELKTFSDAIRGLLAGRPFLSLNHTPYAGAFASGGMLPRSGYALVGERGPELAYLPGGTQITNNERTKEVLGSTGAVYNVTNNFKAPPPDPHTWARQQRFELGALT